MGINNSPERVAIHMFSKDFVPSYNADNGRTVNMIRTEKFLFNVGDPINTVLGAVLPPVGPIGPLQRIEIIRMVGHGNSGVFYFPGMQNVSLIAPEWQNLKKFCNPNARLEIHGCGIASQTSVSKEYADNRKLGLADTIPGTFNGSPNGLGLRYLRKAASSFGLPVTGAIDIQVVQQNDWNYEHDTVTVFPDGHFRYDSNETRGMTDAQLERSAQLEGNRINKELIEKRKYPEARLHLGELIRNYPRTPAADWARERLKANFAPLAPMQPD